MATQLNERPTNERHTPWMIYDLERIAWALEYRSDELSAAEIDLVHAVADRLANVHGR
jgi:hypothetical protein